MSPSVVIRDDALGHLESQTHKAGNSSGQVHEVVDGEYGDLVEGNPRLRDSSLSLYLLRLPGNQECSLGKLVTAPQHDVVYCAIVREQKLYSHNLLRCGRHSHNIVSASAGSSASLVPRLPPNEGVSFGSANPIPNSGMSWVMW